MHRRLRLVVLTAVWLPLAAFAQGSATTTFSTSYATGFGSTNAIFHTTTSTIGPSTILIGERGTCSIPSGPPYPNCTLGGGSGTTSDPFSYSCTVAPPLTGCTLPGQQFVVNVGTINFDTAIFSQTALVAQTPLPIPLPWVPLGSAIAIMLLAVLRRQRGAPR